MTPAASTCVRMLAAALLLPGAAAIAQTYPAKTVRVVVTFAAGGGTDVTARILSAKLSERWGQSVVVDNRPGGGTVIGSEFVAKSMPDGYTLMVTSSGHAVNPSLMAKLPYDTLNDFVPITLISASPMAVLAHPSLPVKSAKELIAFARARPKQLDYGNGGPTGMMAGQLFNMLAKVDLQSVPYKGGGPMMIDLMGGHLTIAVAVASSVTGPVRAHKVRLLGIAATAPSKALPEATPIGKSDLPGYEALDWFGLFAPKGTPREVTAKIQRDAADIIAMPETQQRLLDSGGEPSGISGEKFDALIRREIAMWRKVAQTMGIKAQ